MTKRKYDVFVRITDPSIKPRVMLQPRTSMSYTPEFKPKDDIRNLSSTEAAQLSALLGLAARISSDGTVDAFNEGIEELDRQIEDMEDEEPNEWDEPEPRRGLGDFINGIGEALKKGRERRGRRPTSIDPNPGFSWQHQATEPTPVEVREPFESGVGIVTIGDKVAIRIQHIPGFGPARLEFTPERAEEILRGLDQAIDNARSHREGAGNAAGGDGSPEEPYDTPADPTPSTDAPVARDPRDDAVTLGDLPSYDDRIPAAAAPDVAAARRRVEAGTLNAKVKHPKGAVDPLA
jgi:hypothetical protein